MYLNALDMRDDVDEMAGVTTASVEMVGLTTVVVAASDESAVVVVAVVVVVVVVVVRSDKFVAEVEVDTVVELVEIIEFVALVE